MTKHQGRDKEFSAKSHRKKINGRQSSMEDVRIGVFSRGIVNLARR